MAYINGKKVIAIYVGNKRVSLEGIKIKQTVNHLLGTKDGRFIVTQDGKKILIGGAVNG